MQRLLHHPILGPLPDAAMVTFEFNGESVEGRAGEPIAIALWVAGIRKLRSAGPAGEPRGLYCGIGHCYECRVTVDGVPNQPACLIPVRGGMAVASSWDRHEPGAGLPEGGEADED